MNTQVLVRLAAPVLLLGIFSFRPAPPAANVFRLKLNGKALSGNAESPSCLLMMNALTLTAKVGSSHLMIEVMPGTFSKVPATVPLQVNSVDKYAKVHWFPQGMHGGKPFYVSKSGTLTITSYNPTTRTISGTFSCKGVLVDGLREKPSDTMQITDGAFENVTFRKM